MYATSMFAFFLLLVAKGSLGNDNGTHIHWGYTQHNGPDQWGKECRDGFRQSPIDIRASDVDYALLHRMHFVHYDIDGPINIVNNGHTVKVDGFDKWRSKQPYIQGGGLKHRYKLVQFHFHWSQHDHHGSEHKIGGLHYPAELHLVHVREDLELEDAMRRPDGVAVVGVFIVIGHDGSSIAAFSPTFDRLLYPGNHSEVTSFRVRTLLPAHTEAFYRYVGSLTTPDCNEAVIWTVLADPISITRSQIKQMRQLHSSDNSPLLHNTRPIQPLNGRRILYRPSTFDKKLLCGGKSGVGVIVGFLVSVFFSLH